MGRAPRMLLFHAVYPQPWSHAGQASLNDPFSYVDLPGLNPALPWDTSDMYVTG